MATPVTDNLGNSQYLNAGLSSRTVDKNLTVDKPSAIVIIVASSPCREQVSQATWALRAWLKTACFESVVTIISYVHVPEWESPLHDRVSAPRPSHRPTHYSPRRSRRSYSTFRAVVVVLWSRLADALQRIVVRPVHSAVTMTAVG
jgi:hypothetical protein